MANGDPTSSHLNSENSESVSSVRLSPPIQELLADLGPLADLAGTWEGNGFNLIARPNRGRIDPFLQLNLTRETLQFNFIDAPIPNRGFGQPDITLFGLHYLQQISDAVDRGLLHIEPGLWVTVPATSDPPEPSTVVRMASIPHGNAIVAQGLASQQSGPPVIPPANTIPLDPGNPTPPITNIFPEYNLGTSTPFRTNPLDPGISQQLVTNPNSLLVAAISGQTIEQTVTLQVSTFSDSTTVPDFGGGVSNIAFLTQPNVHDVIDVFNATTTRVDATFWIERVKNRSGHGTFLQLQYSQTVLLRFADRDWPHVSVATLRK